MEIVIKETGEVRLLNFLHPESGTDCTSYFVGDNNTLNTCTIVDGQHTMSKSDYDWWANSIAKYMAATTRMDKFLAEKNKHYFAGVSITAYVMYKPAIEWADYINSELDKIESIGMKMIKYKFIIVCRRSRKGSRYATTLGKAKLCKLLLEIKDKNNGIYTPNFYAIKNIETGEFEE